jgi:hypothetical protein
MLNDSMNVNIELEVMWKEAVLAKFVVVSQYLFGRTEENLKKPQSRELISLLRFE